MLVAAAGALLVPATVALTSKVVAALVLVLAAEVDSATRRSLLPMLRPPHGQRAVSGRLPEQVQTLGREAGVREQL